jgi:hypothetical protein
MGRGSIASGDRAGSQAISPLPGGSLGTERSNLLVADIADDIAFEMGWAGTFRGIFAAK